MLPQAPDQPSIVQLLGPTDSNRPGSRCSFLVIPEFEASATRTWIDTAGDPWLVSSLPNEHPTAYILAFEPGIRRQTFQWSHITEYGDMLLVQLLAFAARNPAFNRHPLFLVAHGLGGLILKRCLGILLERFLDPSYKSLRQNIGGVVLLGCPQPSPDKQNDAKKVMDMLRATGKGSEKKTRNSMEGFAPVLQVCQRFGDVIGELPLLSFFETKESRTSKSIFSPRQLLGDATLCEVISAKERLCGLASTHDNLSNLAKNPSLVTELASFVSLSTEIRVMLGSSRTSNRLTRRNYDRLLDGQWEIDLDDTASIAETITESNGNGPWMSLPEPSLVQPDGNTIFHHKPLGNKVRLPCYILPEERNVNLVGREDVIDAIDRVLLPENAALDGGQQSKLRSFALYGVGGLGKTQLAIEYVYSRKDAFDAVFWCHAADPSRLANDFLQISTRLGLDEGGKIRDQNMIRNAALEWLTNSSTKTPDTGQAIRWLLIFDNAENLADLRKYWPGSGYGSILITSRDPLAKSQIYLDSPIGLELQPFDLKASAAWLRELTGFVDASAEDLMASERIAQELGGLPLAITRISSAISRQNLSLSEFLALYSDDTFRSNVYGAQYGPHQVPLWTTFAFQQLSARTRTMLELTCFFDPDSIPERFFTNMIRKERKHTHLPDFPANVLEYLEARTELTRCSLIRRNVQRNEINVHRVVQDAALISVKSETIIFAFESALEMVKDLWPSYAHQDYDVQRLEESAPMLPHIARLRKQYEMCQPLQEAEQLNNTFGVLLAEAAWYNIERGDPVEALRLCDLATTLLEDAPTVTPLFLTYTYQVHSQAANVLGQRALCLAKAYQCVGVLEDVKGEQILNIRHRARAYGELSEALMLDRQFEAGIEAARSAANLFHRCYELDNHNVLWLSEFPLVMECYGMTSLGGEERLDAAATLLTNRLELKKDFFGGRFMYTQALVYAYLGNVRFAQSRITEAFAMFMLARKHIVETVGENDKLAAALSAKIGYIHQIEDRLPQSRDCFLEALRVYGSGPLYSFERVWTSFLLVEVLEDLRDPTASGNRQAVQYALLDLSLKVGERLDKDRLKLHLSPWAVLI